MPYRRLPKTDMARLKALHTLLNNNDIYMVRNRFIDWKDMGRAQQIHDRLRTACEQYRVNRAAQVRNARKVDPLLRKAIMYVSHFLQVLFMAVERGEIRRQYLSLYGLEADTMVLPNIKTTEGILEWGQKIIEGEQQRVKKGGRAIYNPTIGMVATHFDIFKSAYEAQMRLKKRTSDALERVSLLRPDADEVLLSLWNQIEKHYENEPPEVRFAECRKLGVVYYYRRNEKHLY